MALKNKIPTVTSCIYKGDDWDYQVTIKKNGVIYDGSASVWEAHLRDGDGNLIASHAIDAADAANGVIVLNLSNTLTTSISVSLCYSDLQETMPGGKIQTHLILNHSVTGDITHD